MALVLHPPFFVRGEAGKALGPELVSLESLDAGEPVLKLRSMGAGLLEWTQPAGGAAPPPDRGQEVSLFDRLGNRLFVGKAKVVFDWQQGGLAMWQVRVEDFWSVLEETPLVSTVLDSVGTPAQRPLASFATGDLAATISTLMGMMVAAGVPFQAGTVSPCFSVPRMTFAKMMLAPTLVDMLRWIPDAMTRVDYGGTAPPRLHVVRRGSAEAVTLALGTEADDTQHIRLVDHPELRPAFVEVAAATINAQGRLTWGSQVAGDAGAAAARKQRVVVSGPENNVVLPFEVVDQVRVWSHSTVLDYFAKAHKATRNYITMWGSNPVQAHVTIKQGSNVVWLKSGENIGTAYTTLLGQFPGGWVACSFGELNDQRPPDWLVEQLGLQEGWLVGEVWASDPQGGSVQRRQDLIDLFGPDVAWMDGTVSPNVYFMVRRFTITPEKVWLMPSGMAAAFASGPTIFRESDFDFIFPPANLAANLLAAQDWLPWSGMARLGPAQPEIPVPGNIVNATGSPHSLWATAGALVESTEVDLRRHVSYVTLGSPPRTSPGSLMERFRSAARDNIAT